MGSFRKAHRDFASLRGVKGESRFLRCGRFAAFGRNDTSETLVLLLDAGSSPA
jgi:hypothetical protein